MHDSLTIPPSQGASTSHGALGSLPAGSVYALGLQTGGARLALQADVLAAGLAAGQTCVLATPLDPARDPDLHNLLTRAPFAAALAEQRLKVFTTRTDAGAQLMLRGAAGYVREFEHFGVPPGALIVIDQADDLFTLHDPHACEAQARTYADWSARHGHVLLMLHLRTSTMRPLLDGNQAALDHFAGVACVARTSEGMVLRTDLWQTRDDIAAGQERVLQLADFGLSARRSAQAVPSVAGPAQQVWVVGPRPGALPSSTQRIDWRHAGTLAEVLDTEAPSEPTNALVVLDERTDFRRLLADIAALRRLLGPEARILVRESSWRLREHDQRRLLMRAGVDGVIGQAEPPSVWADQLLGVRLGGQFDAAEAAATAQDLWQDPDTVGSEGWLSIDDFVSRARCLLAAAPAPDLPVTLAEIELGGTIDLGAAPPHRHGDLGTRDEHRHRLLLAGCRERHALEVVTRWIDRIEGAHLRHITLTSDRAAISERLDSLEADRAPADAATGSTGGAPEAHRKVVNMPGSTRSKGGRGRRAAVATCVLAIGLAGSLPESVQAQAAPPAAATRSPVEAFTEAYAAGRYVDAARAGEAALQARPDDHELRLQVAQSLAWTGQYAPALVHYRALAGTPLAARGQLGEAQVLLWSGQAHRADPLFRAVLKTDPTLTEARDGLESAGRALRPRTAVQVAAARDNGEARRQALNLAHRWRDPSLQQVFEVSGQVAREERTGTVAAQSANELGLSWEHLGLPLAPRLSLSTQRQPVARWFGDLGLRVADGALSFEIGRVNWGKLVFSPEALRAGLTADRAGLVLAHDSPVGSWWGSLQHYAVSDHNTVQDAQLRFTPAWQPLPAASGLKLFAGLYGRKAERRDARYWTPADGYYTANVGVALGRWEADHELWGELQASRRIGGEGADGWTASLGGKRWLDRDWALVAQASYQSTRRDGSGYRAATAALTVERRW